MRNLFLSICMLAFAACSDSTEPAPEPQFLGDYNVTLNLSGGFYDSGVRIMDVSCTGIVALHVENEGTAGDILGQFGNQPITCLIDGSPELVDWSSAIWGEQTGSAVHFSDTFCVYDGTVKGGTVVCLASDGTSELRMTGTWKAAKV